MKLPGKTAMFTASFLFLFFLISTLYAEPLPEPQPNPDSGEGTPIEPQISRDGGEDSLFDESLLGEEAFLSEGPFLEEEPFLSEETFSDEEPFISEEGLLSEETFSDEEEPFLSEETLLAEETFEENFQENFEENFLDDDAFFFEAPPLIIEAPIFEIRSLDEIFPDFSQRQRRMAMSSTGLRNSFVKDESPTIIPDPDLGIDLLDNIMKRNPSHLIEALVVLPYNERELDLLDIYNALGRIEKIKDHFVTLNGNDFYVFTESTRIESNRSRRAISDPLPAVMLPFSETMYLRLKEFSFGDLFIRGDVSISMYGITYSMTNFIDVRYFLFPIMRAERFITIIYLEPVKEGMLIYSMTGFYLPGFIADRVNLTPNINRRIQIFVNWITDGLREQENTMAEQEDYLSSH